MGSYEYEDQMTPKERLMAIKEGKQVDRLSLNAFIGEHAAWIQGLSIAEYHHSPEKMAKAQIEAYRTYHTDGISVGVGLTGIAEALGSKIGYPVDNTPYVAEHILKDIQDVDKLKVTDNKKDGRLQIILDTVKEVITITNIDINALDDIETNITEIMLKHKKEFVMTNSKNTKK